MPLVQAEGGEEARRTSGARPASKKAPLPEGFRNGAGRGALQEGGGQGCRTARKWAATAAREADKLLAEAQKRAKTKQRQMRIKAALRRTGKVLKAAGRAAIVAGIAAGIASARAEKAKR